MNERKEENNYVQRIALGIGGNVRYFSLRRKNSDVVGGGKPREGGGGLCPTHVQPIPRRVFVARACSPRERSDMARAAIRNTKPVREHRPLLTNPVLLELRTFGIGRTQSLRWKPFKRRPEHLPLRASRTVRSNRRLSRPIPRPALRARTPHAAHTRNRQRDGHPVHRWRSPFHRRQMRRHERLRKRRRGRRARRTAHVQVEIGIGLRMRGICATISATRTRRDRCRWTSPRTSPFGQVQVQRCVARVDSCFVAPQVFRVAMEGHARAFSVAVCHSRKSAFCGGRFGAWKRGHTDSSA